MAAAVAAPHGPLPEGAYPGTCRGLTPAEREAREAAGRRPSWRVRAGGEVVTAVDRLGAGDVGDRRLRVRRADGVASYKVAVVVDDADAGDGGGRAGRRPARHDAPADVAGPAAGAARCRRTPTCRWCSGPTASAWPSATGRSRCRTWGPQASLRTRWLRCSWRASGCQLFPALPARTWPPGFVAHGRRGRLRPGGAPDRSVDVRRRCPGQSVRHGFVTRIPPRAAPSPLDPCSGGRRVADGTGLRRCVACLCLRIVSAVKSCRRGVKRAGMSGLGARPASSSGGMDQHLLELAIRACGGELALARALHTDIPAIEWWRQVGVPDEMAGKIRSVAVEGRCGRPIPPLT